MTKRKLNNTDMGVMGSSGDEQHFLMRCVAFAPCGMNNDNKNKGEGSKLAVF